MIDFLIVYEHRARELESICLLKAILELRGYTVVIAQVNQLNMFRYKTLKKPKVLVTFALYDNYCLAFHAFSIVGSCSKIVNLQWEQIFANSSGDVDFHTPKESAVLATHICWGEECYKRLQAHGIRHAVMTGAIHLDFLKSRLASYYLSRDEIERKYHLPHGKMLLYISSFTITSATDREKELLKCKISAVDSRAQIAIESKQKTLNIFKQILDEDKNSYIIYRPHPGENIDKTLMHMEKKYDSFLIISEESVKQWILIADQIITWQSTAVAEVYYAKKNCIILRPVQIPEKWDNALFTNAKFIKNYEEFVLALQSPQQEFPIPCDNLMYYYGKDTCELVALNVVNLLERVRNTSEYDLPKVLKIRYWPFCLRRLIKRIICGFHITSHMWPLSKINFVRERLQFLEYSQQKAASEKVSNRDILTITNKLKVILKDDYL